MPATRVEGATLATHQLSLINLRTGTERHITAHGVILARTSDHVDKLIVTAQAWNRYADDITRTYGQNSDQASRAQFAATAAYMVAQDLYLLTQKGDVEGTRSPIVAAIYHGPNRDVVLGLGDYIIRYSDGRPTASISLVATNPLYHPHVRSGIDMPNYKPITVRGIGTLVTRTIGLDLLAEDVAKACLLPYDDEAAIFWAGRGFRETSSGLMCIYGREGMATLAERCAEMNPDRPDQGEFVAATNLKLQPLRSRRPY